MTRYVVVILDFSQQLHTNSIFSLSHKIKHTLDLTIQISNRYGITVDSSFYVVLWWFKGISDASTQDNALDSNQSSLGLLFGTVVIRKCFHYSGQEKVWGAQSTVCKRCFSPHFSSLASVLREIDRRAVFKRFFVQFTKFNRSAREILLHSHSIGFLSNRHCFGNTRWSFLAVHPKRMDCIRWKGRILPQADL